MLVFDQQQGALECCYYLYDIPQVVLHRAGSQDILKFIIPKLSVLAPPPKVNFAQRGSRNAMIKPAGYLVEFHTREPLY